MRYLNASRSVKTFYGVKFNPGESHDVPGYINVPGFIRVADLPKEPPKADKKVNDVVKRAAKPTGSAVAAKADTKSAPTKSAAIDVATTASSAAKQSETITTNKEETSNGTN